MTNPNFISQAIQNLRKVIEIAKDEKKQQRAEACHKLGLLYNMEGKDKSTKDSLQYL